MTFLARYNDECAGAGCDDPIERGDIVEYVDDRLVHEGCSRSHSRALWAYVDWMRT